MMASITGLEYIGSVSSYGSDCSNSDLGMAESTGGSEEVIWCWRVTVPPPVPGPLEKAFFDGCRYDDAHARTRPSSPIYTFAVVVDEATARL